MLALALYEERLCPSGHYLPESADPANEYAYKGRNMRCHACTATAQEADRLKGNPSPSGLLFGAELRRGRG